MKYPSLLYFSEPDLKPLDVSVFEDLQLLNFIGKDIAKAILVPCRGDNISERQNVFRLLENNSIRTQFEKIYSLIENICELDDIMNQERCEAERNVTFASLLCSVIAFAKAASMLECRNSKILSRFTGFFREIENDSRFREAEEKSDALIASEEHFRYNTFTINRTSLKMSRGQSDTFYDRICSCVKRLKLDNLDDGICRRRRLSTDIINAYIRLYPDEIKAFDGFYKQYMDLYSSEITKYKTEIGFYLTMMKFFDKIKKINIPLIYPKPESGHVIRINDAYDVSLIAKDETNIVPNDACFTDDEPFYYLTGANGGGKTTYLRTIGISMLLYINGCPIPCRSAEIGFISGIFTHFPHDERFDGTGRFVEEQNRVNKILSCIDESSAVLLNETYSSTNEENAVRCTVELAENLYAKKIFGLYITHQHAIGKTKIPYLNVLIDKEDSNKRTFKVARQKDTGESFAIDILEKYSLTKDALEKRFGNQSSI